jgi:hypothetical protein
MEETQCAGCSVVDSEEPRIELSRKVSRTQLNVHSGYAAIDHRC